jgi:Uma2 family endonuclease
MMSTPTNQLPLAGTMAGFRRFSVAEYHRLIEIGLLTEDDPVELIEGYLVMKMARNPPHDCVIQLLTRILARVVPDDWDFRTQCAMTLSDSEPEPDFQIVRGSALDYQSRHPTPPDVGLVIEVADSTLPSDRSDKLRIYARAGIPVYWIINLPDRLIEVYTQPSGPTPTPVYGHRRDYHPGDAVPLHLDGTVVAHVDVNAVLP